MEPYMESSLQSAGLYQAQTLSITAIVLFNIWPKSFPNGFFGFDIFFVVSGYLISLSLIKSKSSIKEFYFDKIKTFGPIYFGVVFFNFLYGFNTFYDSQYIRIAFHTFWDLTFTTNFQIIKLNIDNFKVIAENDFLLYLWPLIIEIQVYFLAPLIYYFLTKIKRKNLILIIIGISSFLYDLFYSNNPLMAASTFARIWQFLFGAFAFSCFSIKSNNRIFKMVKLLLENNTKLYYSSLFVLIITVFYPYDFYLHSVVMKLLISIATFISITQKEDKCIENTSCQKIFNYISKMYNIIYLIHAPMISYMHVKSDLIDEISPHLHYLLPICILFASFIIHKCLQKPIETFAPFVIFVITFIFFTFTLYLCIYFFVFPLY